MYIAIRMDLKSIQPIENFFNKMKYIKQCHLHFLKMHVPTTMDVLQAGVHTKDPH